MGKLRKYVTGGAQCAPRRGELGYCALMCLLFSCIPVCCMPCVGLVVHGGVVGLVVHGGVVGLVVLGHLVVGFFVFHLVVGHLVSVLLFHLRRHV